MGIPQSRTRSARAPHPSAARSHISRLAARWSSGSIAVTVTTAYPAVAAGPAQIAAAGAQITEAVLELGAHSLAEDRQQRLGRQRTQPADRLLDLGHARLGHAGGDERLPDVIAKQRHERAPRRRRSCARSARTRPAPRPARRHALRPARRPRAASGSGPRSARRRSRPARRAAAPGRAPPEPRRR